MLIMLSARLLRVRLQQITDEAQHAGELVDLLLLHQHAVTRVIPVNRADVTGENRPGFMLPDSPSSSASRSSLRRAKAIMRLNLHPAYVLPIC